jgi:ribonuclease HII
MLCGVDEAGRGPVIGPMVVAAVMVEDDGQLRSLGVRDSKQLKVERREQLALRISHIAEVRLEVVQPHQIDANTNGHLNRFEAEVFARLIDMLRAEDVFVDACDANERRFAGMIMRHLSYRPRLVCEHKADATYPVVSAASIIAKTRRDAIVREIEAEVGQPIGTGYAHDKVTIAFLENWIKEKGCLPPHTRRSWATAKRAYSAAKTTRLTDWDE